MLELLRSLPQDFKVAHYPASAHGYNEVVVMRGWNRAKLLWGYLRRKSTLNALPDGGINLRPCTCPHPAPISSAASIIVRVCNDNLSVLARPPKTN